MATFSPRIVKNRSKNQNKWTNNFKKVGKLISNPNEIFKLVKTILFDSNYLFLIACILMPIEFLLNFLIVSNIKYTEIDWTAYMQEVEGFLNGTFNYYELKGDTGPLVYPAGFVYIYSLFYGLCSQGANIKLAQYIFIAIYLVFIGAVFFIYKKTKRVPPIALIIMCLTSHRIHSIFVLRLFNDPIAMLFLYLSISFILLKHWRIACIFFSFAVSIKMNVILFAPALFIILNLTHGLLNTFKFIFLCAIIQLILGSPFLFTYPIAYIHRSFDFGRQFFFIWTVNWKFLPENVFLSRYFQIVLLTLHVIVLLAFLNKCLKNIGGLRALFTNNKRVKLSSDFIVFLMFISNYIGICFSRSLHYQFYVWYYHTIAYLLWSTSFSNTLRFLLFGTIELCWNIYPSNFYSSIGLNLSHMILLKGLWNALDNETTLRLTIES